MKRVLFCGATAVCGCLFLLATNLQAADSAQTRFQFRTPQTGTYRVETATPQQSRAGRAQWLKAWPENDSTNFVEFGSRVVVQLVSADDLNRLTEGHSLELSRTVSSNVFILQAPDAQIAAQEAHRLAALPGVLASYPVIKQRSDLNGPYAPLPSDTFYPVQWPMEHRNDEGSVVGVNINIRAAWPYTLGQGVIVAVADTGVELNHPELIQCLSNSPHYNFAEQSANVGPIDRLASGTHGTEVAGLIAANINNARMAGVSPGAKLASWVIYESGGGLTSDENLMDMYQSASDTVGVQNHSWGSGTEKALGGATLLEKIGIENATTLGRNGLGVVMVRSAGNDRALLARADDDSYADDPHVITVGAVRIDNRIASYSEPGACVLVAAPTGDFGTTPAGLFTTDLLGNDGVNIINYFPPYEDLNGYVFDALGFKGTSSTAPQISGIAALVLSMNTNLGCRDVQQILALSSRHWDMADPDVVRNGAGFLVSHNVGFGVPDAGEAVRLATIWPNRPPLSTLSIVNSTPLAIPDAGLKIEVTGNAIPPELASVYCYPGTGLNADDPTPALPLVDIGLATSVPAVNLTNKGALISLGVNSYSEKASNAAQAGAAFAIIYHNDTNGSYTVDLNTDTAPIPVVFTSKVTGEKLKELFQTNASAVARIHLQSADRVFHVNSALLCEHVGVRMQFDHPNRGHLRVTLLSPQGTRSVLQRMNDDTSPAPSDWTYWSTHHFFESSVGDWKVCIGDEIPGSTGAVRSVSLIIRGSQITDTDGDGLDDDWEMDHFGNLSHAPKEDLEPDGYSNAREQVMGTDPNVVDVPFRLDMSPWQLTGARRMRLSWPANTNFTYEVRGGSNPGTLSHITNLAGQFPEMDWFTPYTQPWQFYRVIATPLP